MKVPRRTAFALSSAVVLIVILTLCLAANLMNAVGAPKPRILQSSPLLIWQKGHICSAKGQPNCSLARGNASAAPGDRKGMSAVANVTSANSGAKFPSAPLARCSTATLLGAWDNNTLVPLPYDGFAPFLAEARGVLSPGERNLFIKQRNGTDVLPKYLPVDYPIGSFAKPPEEEPLPFSPPCYYHFYSKDEILRLFTGKWVFFFGDSNTRGMVLGLLAILDLDHRSPYSDAKWFNTSAEEIGWPHTSSLHYFFKEDGSILFKTGAWRDPPPLPEGGFTFRLSFKMTFVRAPTGTFLHIRTQPALLYCFLRFPLCMLGSIVSGQRESKDYFSSKHTLKHRPFVYCVQKAPSDRLKADRFCTDILYRSCPGRRGADGERARSVGRRQLGAARALLQLGRMGLGQTPRGPWELDVCALRPELRTIF